MPRDRGRKYQPIGEEEGWKVGEDKTLRFPIYGDVADVGDWEAEVRLSTEEGGANLLTWDATVEAPDVDDDPEGVGAIVTSDVDSYTGVTGGTYWGEVWRIDTGNVAALLWGPWVIAPSIAEAGP